MHPNKNITIKHELFSLSFTEYMAWFIGWNYALLNQLAALTVVVAWSKYIVHLVVLISGQNVTTLIVEAPVAWNESATNFYVTGQVINLPAIAITIAITFLLVSGIRSTSIVNLVLVVFKIIVLLIFIFACAKYVKRENYTPFFPQNEGKPKILNGQIPCCVFRFILSVWVYRNAARIYLCFLCVHWFRIHRKRCSRSKTTHQTIDPFRNYCICRHLHANLYWNMYSDGWARLIQSTAIK